MAISEPLVPEALVDMTELPALRYLVRCRVVEFQDWSVTRHTSDDDDGHGRPDDDDEDDSGDSNHNRYHPGLDYGGHRSSWGPKLVRLTGAGDDAPSQGNGRWPTFRSRRTILVGSFACPVVTSCADGRQAAVRCVSRAIGRQSTVHGVRTRAVAGPVFPVESCQGVKDTADPSLCLHRPTDADLGRSVDPMLCEAATRPSQSGKKDNQAPQPCEPYHDAPHSSVPKRTVAAGTKASSRRSYAKTGRRSRVRAPYVAWTR